VDNTGSNKRPIGCEGSIQSLPVVLGLEQKWLKRGKEGDLVDPREAVSGPSRIGLARRFQSRSRQGRRCTPGTGCSRRGLAFFVAEPAALMPGLVQQAVVASMSITVAPMT
jgi:hypothetical protein